jgi:tripartite-type tricarboxylate transporter receptor subunit TctC
MTNRTGGTGAIATQYVYDRPADGYTVLFHAENPQLYQVLGLSNLTFADFEPIILTAQGPTVIVVHPDSPIQTYEQLIEQAKANPGKVNLGISGVGGQPFVTAAILNSIEGVQFNQVAFDGDGPLATALLGKHIDVTGIALLTAVPQVQGGALRALAVVANEPLAVLPGVPALGQIRPQARPMLTTAGFFYGVHVKKGTPQPVIDKLREAFLAAFNDPKFIQFANERGLVLLGHTGQAARDYMTQWQRHMAWLIYDAGGAKESPEKFNIARP